MAKSNKELIEYVSSHSAVVSKLFDKFIIELAKAGIPYDQLPDDKVFKLSDYPESAKNASRLADKMRKALKDELIKSIDGAISLAMDITSAEFKPYTRLKDDALQSFRDAVTATYTDTRINTSKGLSLSNRVWNYTEQTKSEFELAMSQILEDGLTKGTSAEEIGRKIRSKLRNPDMMYRRYHTKKIQSNGLKIDIIEWRRRVVDSEGNVHFIKEDLAKVGRGVYRSARQNALRMAATEVNMAYQYAENMRYQKEPFVLGYRINLSTNHTCKDKDGVPRPFHDMCDELEGDYPKWFLWRSWHPRCRCYMTAIRCSKEEMRKIAKLPQDEYERYVSPNAIHNMPDCYNQYIEDNRDRIEASIERGTQPYWIQDNYVDGNINGGFTARTAPVEVMPVSTQENYAESNNNELRRYKIQKAAEERHARRNAEDIQRRWDIDRIKAWELNVQYYEADTSKMTIEEVRKNLNWVAINEGAGIYPDNIINSLSEDVLRMRYELECIKANDKIAEFAEKNTIKKKALSLLRKYPDMPSQAVLRLKKYLYNSNIRDQYNYIGRMKQNVKGVDNLKKLIEHGVDFTEISANTPYNLLPDTEEYLLLGYKIDKRLFDSLDYFVPCKIDYKGSGFYNSAKVLVHLNSTDGRGKFHKRNVIYHEYGHAIDFQDGCGTNSVDNLMSELKKEMNEEDYNALDQTLEDEYRKYSFNRDLSNREKIMSIMDIIQSLTDGRHGCIDIDGHNRSYWNGSCGKINKHTEFFAHMSEIFFLGNERLQEIKPDWFNKMKDLFEKIVIKQ